jgi:A1 cistron-splicing factor AAR2
MDSFKARALGSLLLLDAPAGMQFGIDNQCWEIGPLFKGVKCIPPGAHFIHFALKDEEYLHKQGFFIFVKSSETFK